MRRCLALVACLCVVALAGCSSWGGGAGETTYTYSQKDAGNIAASDSLGCGLWQHNGVQAAFVPDSE